MHLRLTRVAAEGVLKLKSVIERGKGDSSALFHHINCSEKKVKNVTETRQGKFIHPQTSQNQSSEILSLPMRVFRLTQDTKSLNHVDWRCSETWRSLWITTWNLMPIIKHFQTFQIEPLLSSFTVEASQRHGCITRCENTTVFSLKDW